MSAAAKISPSTAKESPLISVLVPVWERPEPLRPLYQEYAGALRQAGKRFEFVFICEPGYQDDITDLLSLAQAGEPIRVLQVSRNLDEASLYHTVAADSLGSIVVTLPAYRRIEAEYLPRLIDRVLEGTDLVVARRWPRRDAWINRLQNRALHHLLHWTVGGRFRDVACGVQAMQREVLLSTPVYGDSFRFFGLLAQQSGFRVEEMDAPQHPGDRRARLYRPSLYIRRMIDLLGIYVILRFTTRPLRFFGPIGVSLIILGLGLLLLTLIRGLGPVSGTGRVVLLAGVFLLVLGIQAVAIGIIGEMMVFLQAPARTRYRVVERVN
ncbi:MAG TPA: hypothetical protein VGP80_11355 [Gemmatimonadales bacterium]|jgi:hypothetical protein|nr:hypothetical protein [Gemmatimonadales bacterium]